ncbi:MAG: excinuclease ABC subunit UvrC [Clostridiales bacterium]
MDKIFWQEKLKSVPQKPGVYIFRDENQGIIYVGKAESLKNRVTSYFQESKNIAPKTLAMREKARSLEYILVDSPAEALLLECNLIKLYRPHYNIMLKDDKTYPYLKLTTKETFPRLLVVRNYKNDGSIYFGPYTNVGAMNNTVALIRSTFPLRNCGNKMGRTKGRTCLNYDLGNCSGPCVGKISPEDYAKNVKHIEEFLNGDADVILKELTAKMENYAEVLDFENAAIYRDKINAVREVLVKQKISIANSQDNRDFISLYQDGNNGVAAVFFVRQGKLIGREHLFLTGCAQATPEEIYRNLLPEFYSGDRMVPPEICLEAIPDEGDLVAEILRKKRKGAVHFHVPQRGEKHRLMSLAAKNAKLLLDEENRNKSGKDQEYATALENLRQALGLVKTPQRIECYDISHIQGAYTVGSMVVFQDGKPKKDQYRKFKIKTVTGIDDFASLNEVLDRRFRHGIEDKKEGKTQGFANFPDLFIIDGGKGQLSATLKIKEKYNSPITFVSLAKREEELIVPWSEESLILPKASPEFHLIQRIRDEAHRFAITFHRNLRTKGQTKSALEEIPGIGPKRRKELLKHFHTIKAIEKATIEELALVEGMNKDAASAVYDYFQLKQK